MASLQSIADELGISKATVSLVLSGKAGNRVNEETSKKVKEVALKFNYHVNDLARSLRTGQSMTIGVIVTDISNEFFGKLTFYIQEEAKKYGYLVFTANSNEDPQELQVLLRMFLTKQTDGLIVVPTVGSIKMLESAIGTGVPVVLLDRYINGLTADYVGVNNYGATRNAVSRIIKEGYRHMAIFTYNFDLNALNARKNGYIDVMKENNIYNESLVFNINYKKQKESIEKSIRDVFKHIDDIDALYFTSRRVFTESISCMNRLGLVFPQRLKILCFDEVESFVSTHINIDFIKQPIRQMAIKVMDLLISRIKNKETESGTYIFEPEYLQHEGTLINYKT